MNGRNHENYPDPTATEALARVARWEKKQAGFGRQKNPRYDRAAKRRVQKNKKNNDQ